MQARPLSKALARLTAAGREALLQRWRLATLPTFNSMSAEAGESIASWRSDGHRRRPP
jgi:hypothetical protein